MKPQTFEQVLSLESKVFIDFVNSFYDFENWHTNNIPNIETRQNLECHRRLLDLSRILSKNYPRTFYYANCIFSDQFIFKVFPWISSTFELASDIIESFRISFFRWIVSSEDEQLLGFFILEDMLLKNNLADKLWNFNDSYSFECSFHIKKAFDNLNWHFQRAAPSIYVKHLHFESVETHIKFTKNKDKWVPNFMLKNGVK